MHKHEEFTRLFSDTPGWFDPHAVATWDALLTFQEQCGLTGDFLEVGVYKGKSAGLAALHARQGESCVFVDMLSMNEAAARIQDAVPGADCTYLEMESSELKSSPVMKTLKRTVRWVHIDGGHSAAEVTQDLETAHAVLHPMGVVVLDDFFSPAYPQIVQAMFQYLLKRPKDFSLFLCGHNKGYLCRPGAARMYLMFVKDRLHHEMELRGCGGVTLYKTTTPKEVNAFGSCPQSEAGVTYRGLDSDHNAFLL